MRNIDLLIKPASGMCNMNCKYCFYADVGECRDVKNYGFMNEQTQENIVKKALTATEEYCAFGFQGGEPTLAGLAFYRRQVELEKKYNINNVYVVNSIQTNGYAIDEEWARFLAENRFLVGLSLDGPREINDGLRKDRAGDGSYDNIMRTVGLFDRYGVQYNILTVVSKPVALNAKKVYRFFKKNNFRYLQFNECIDPFSNEKDDYSLRAEDYAKFLKEIFDEYYNDFKTNNYVSIRNLDNYVRMVYGERPESCGMCGYCTPYFLIEANGDVFPCDFYVLDRYYMGNINDKTYFELYNSDHLQQFVQESKYVMDKCRRCKWYRLCRGGCKRYREPFVNGRPGLNKFCEAFQAFFEYSYERMQDMVKTLSGARR